MHFTRDANRIKGPLSDGKYLLVIIDLYSRYPFVRLVSSTSARSVIPELDVLFAEQGSPKTVITDNGPPFQGYEFAKFASSLNFKHRKITPLWPQANGEAERMMRNLNKVLQTAHVEDIPIMKAVTAYLRNYRATPHSTTGRTPAELLLHRNIKILLPEIPASPENDSLRQYDRKQKAQIKMYAEQKHLKPDPIKIGDTVLVKQPQNNKRTPAFDPKPYTVVNIKGSMVRARRSGHSITRNISFYKRIPQRPLIPSAEDDDYPANTERFHNVAGKLY